MNNLKERIFRTEHHWKVLILFFAAAAAAFPFSPNAGHLAVLVINAYAMVAFGAMLNRAATRSSWAYHGLVLLVSSFASYWVFKSVYSLVAAGGLTVIIVVAYLAATIWGNFTGSRVSIFLEKKLGVKARWKLPNEDLSQEEKRIRYALLIVLGILAVAVFGASRFNYLAALYVFSLSFLNTGIHTFVRRSRNNGHTMFHNLGLLVQGLNFFFLFRFLAQESMSWTFFLPFAMGGILGGLLVHKISIWVEAKTKTDPDSHLKERGRRFRVDLSLFPKRIILFLVIAAVALVLISDSPLLAAGIIVFAILQYVGFSLISRARARNNRTYEVYAAIMSNGGWLATFGKLNQYEWGMPLFAPYILGVMIGGNLGVAIAMHIERWFGISSD